MPNKNEVLADAVATMVGSWDVADALARLVDGCAHAYPSEAVAVLATNHAGSLELLSANSHRAEALELLQIQHRRGPCVDAIASDIPVMGTGRDELVSRWGEIGQAIADAGFNEVHAFPMHWRGTTIGCLNIFIRPNSATEPAVGQLFADLATLTLVQADDLTASELMARVHNAVTARAVLEQAKGVLAYSLGIGMEAAYSEIVSRARAAGVRLGTIAEQILAEQYGGPTNPGNTFTSGSHTPSI